MGLKSTNALFAIMVMIKIDKLNLVLKILQIILIKVYYEGKKPEQNPS